jgi:TonB-linked SusC/RagA family outer membrane protein
MQVFATRKTPVLGGVLNQQLTSFTKIRMAVRIMKLIAILLLGGCLQLSARGIGQTITISVKDAPLEKVFHVIEKQTDYVFFVKTELLKMAKSVTMQVSNLPLQQVLDLCFKDQPFKYSINGKIITIALRTLAIEKNGNSTGVNQGNDFGDIKGRILNAQGEPVAGATVSVKGANKQTLTNANGEFTLNGVDDKSVLVITHVQYETASLSISGNSIVNATLQIRVNNLDELQVIAYGTTTKRLNTGNVATIKSQDIARQPVNNPLLALQGRVPGLFITQSTGLPGTGVTVRIQGQNSLSNGSDPLYIVDGVPYTSLLLPTLNGILGSSGGNGNISGSGNPLSFINPADIESIEVLKDADATSIYGSRAAAGAILITTKKGKAGQTRVNINFQNGWGKVPQKLDLLNTEQYLQMRKEAFQNDGLSIPNSSTTPNPGNYDLTVWDSTRYTDWQKVLIGGTAKYMDVQTSISGGSPNTQFVFAPSYHRETTVFPGDLNNERGSLHFNISNVSSNQKFKLQFSGSYVADDNKLQKVDLTERAIALAPNAPTLYNPDGTLNWAQVNGRSTWDNPLSYMYGKYRNKTENLISNAVISYQIIPGLNVKSSFGYTNLKSTEVTLTPLSVYRPENRATSSRNSGFGNGVIRSWIIEPQATYSRNFGKNKIEALVGTTFNRRKSERLEQAGVGYTSDVLLEDIKSAPTILINSSLNWTYNYYAVFGRINYNYADKYILNYSARRDGSSRFGSNNLFQNFWSVAGAWIFSQEKFIQQNFNVLSFGKLRASYGTTGNEQIGDYRFMNLYSSISAATPYLGVTGLQTTGLPNPDVQWEETRKFQAGLDLGFLNNRILLTANYFHNRSSNQLLTYPLPLVTGFDNIGSYNLPATIQNTGWEFSLQTRNIQSTDFTWSTDFNLTIPKNKLVDYPNLAGSSLGNTLVIGEPFTLTKVYPYQGVDAQTGLYIVADSNGNSTSNPDQLKDKTVLINTSPIIYGGLGNSFTYKGFELYFLFQFVKQKGANYFFGTGTSPGQRSNQPTTVLDRWQKVGDEKPIQKYSTGGNPNPSTALGAAMGSDNAFSDASYIRLKNLSLSWNFPKSWIKKSIITNGRFYAQGQNLLTMTDYLGLDPETRSLTSLPPLRVITVGIQVTF